MGFWASFAAIKLAFFKKEAAALQASETKLAALKAANAPAPAIATAEKIVHVEQVVATKAAAAAGVPPPAPLAG